VGYLRGGGDVNVIKKASLTKYTRVFSLFTAPAVITAMSRLCQEAKAQS
jgi:hypothetical protein